jgi:hypothetical protein
MLGLYGTKKLYGVYVCALALQTSRGGSLKGNSKILGEHLLRAEARMGEMLGHQSSRGGTLVDGGRGSTRTLPPDIDKKASHYAPCREG